MYEYQMVQIPSQIAHNKRGDGADAANFLSRIVNEHASQGWEFFRVDTFTIDVSPGCLGFLLRLKTVAYHCYVVTFRRPV